jgi:hypothetical protein
MTAAGSSFGLLFPRFKSKLVNIPRRRVIDSPDNAHTIKGFLPRQSYRAKEEYSISLTHYVPVEVPSTRLGPTYARNKETVTIEAGRLFITGGRQW